jgi:hypothetical protein
MMSTMDQDASLLRTRAWKARLLSVNVLWVLLGFVYFVWRNDQMSLTLIYFWIAVELVIGVALFVLGVRTRR